MNFASPLQIIFSLLSYQNASNTSVIMPNITYFRAKPKIFIFGSWNTFLSFVILKRRYKLSFSLRQTKRLLQVTYIIFVTGLSEWERCIFLVNHTSSLYHESKNSPSCARLSKYRCVCHVLAIFERLFLNAFLYFEGFFKMAMIMFKNKHRKSYI